MRWWKRGFWKDEREGKRGEGGEKGRGDEDEGEARAKKRDGDGDGETRDGIEITWTVPTLLRDEYLRIMRRI